LSKAFFLSPNPPASLHFTSPAITTAHTPDSLPSAVLSPSPISMGGTDLPSPVSSFMTFQSENSASSPAAVPPMIIVPSPTLGLAGSGPMLGPIRSLSGRPVGRPVSAPVDSINIPESSSPAAPVGALILNAYVGAGGTVPTGANGRYGVPAASALTNTAAAAAAAGLSSWGASSSSSAVVSAARLEISSAGGRLMQSRGLSPDTVLGNRTRDYGAHTRTVPTRERSSSGSASSGGTPVILPVLPRSAGASPASSPEKPRRTLVASHSAQALLRDPSPTSSTTTSITHAQPGKSSRSGTRKP
jgi:hypothetical protein